MEENQKYNRGSEWRKWDLHIHTPASFFWKGGKNLSEMTTVERKTAIESFIKTVNESDVAVFAIQDYWTFDWVTELRKYVEDNPKKLIKTVLPGMELRIECSADFRLNIHVVLSDTVTNQQLSDFKSALKIRIGQDTKNLSNDALIEFAKSLDKSKSKKHGYEDPATLTENKLLELGSKTAEVTRDSLTKAFENIPKGAGFILLPYDTSDGLINLNWEEHPQDDNFFMQTAHIFESRDQKNIDLFNGVKTEANKDFFQNFYKTIGNISKPCVSGSDAHNFSEYGKYPSEKVTWIKANPSFEGLKQITYDPMDRVKIQQLKPEEKSTYSIIDKVEYKNSNGELKTVYLNQNLNSLIGSRAQGKSNLLKNIAYSVDPEQCNLRGVQNKDFLHLNSVKVTWMDGKENTLSESENKEKGILFIPQKYLGELVYEKDPRFDSFSMNLFENKDDFQKALEDYRKFEDINVLMVTSLIREIMAVRSTGIDKAEKLKKLGKKEDYDKEINDINTKIKKFGKTTVTQEEIKDYETLRTNKVEKEKRLKLIQQDIASYKDLKNEDVISSEKIHDFEFSKSSFEKIEKRLLVSDKEFKKEFIDEEIKTLAEEETEVKKHIVEDNKKIEPLQDNIKKNKALLDLTDLLKTKKEVREQIVELQKDISALRKEYGEKKNELISSYLKFEDEYKKLKIDLGVLKYSQVKITVAYDEESFRKFVEENINYYNSTAFKKNEDDKFAKAKEFLTNPTVWTYSRSGFLALFKEIVDAILAGKLLLKSGRDIETVLTNLFKNRYKIDFLQSIANKKGVKFPEMSDGEQMLTLLEFIFKFDDYKYPVLLDQPEDDLDSRAISTIIVDFIRSEKQERQIIIASHNANLVVCGDSEEVIISEKKGTAANPNFEYLTGSIEEGIINKEIVEILEGGKIALRKRMHNLNVPV